MQVLAFGGRSAALVLAAGIGLIGSSAWAQSDSEIRQRIVRQSIAAYSGSCPCPYSIARNGSRCGGRSAYNRRGGAVPLCYPSDVSAAQVAAHRRQR